MNPELSYGIVDTTPIQRALDFNIGDNRDGATYIVASRDPGETQARIDHFARTQPRTVPRPPWWLCIIAAIALIIFTGAPVWSMWVGAALVVGSILRQIRAVRRWSAWRKNVFFNLGPNAQMVQFRDAREDFRFAFTDLHTALRQGDPDLAGRFIWASAEYNKAAGGDYARRHDLHEKMHQAAARLDGSCHHA